MNYRIGGYQVCAKWLKDRKARTLSADDSIVGWSEDHDDRQLR